MQINKNDYPWVEKESNMTKKEWEEHRDWVFGFYGKILGEPIEGGKFYRVRATNPLFDYSSGTLH